MAGGCTVAALAFMRFYDANGHPEDNPGHGTQGSHLAGIGKPSREHHRCRAVAVGRRHVSAVTKQDLGGCGLAVASGEVERGVPVVAHRRDVGSVGRQHPFATPRQQQPCATPGVR